MSTITETRPQQADTGSSPNISHDVCPFCYPGPIVPGVLAECGEQVGFGEHICPDDLSCGCIQCTLCELASDDPCRGCGAGPVPR
ncbi:hypothetical protein [Cellulosimicrobium cellulans]|uniref:hypothetical protein n=1 Tax=Cellulosimicrobium cellulans TaxID=1710 RepID=UPI003C4748F6